MHTRHATPDKGAMALPVPFERLGLNRITPASTVAQVGRASPQ